MLKKIYVDSIEELKPEKSDYYKKLWPFFMKYNNEIIKNNWKLSNVDKKILKIKGMQIKIYDDLIVHFAYMKLQSEFHNEHYHNIKINESDIKIIMMDHHINHSRTMIEYLKNMASLFFTDKHLDRFGSVNIQEAAWEIGYSKKKAIEYDKLFFTDIRNAISHNKYYYKFDENNIIKSFIWFDKKNKKIEYGEKDLFKVSRNIRILIYIFKKIGRQKYKNINMDY